MIGISVFDVQSSDVSVSEYDASVFSATGISGIAANFVCTSFACRIQVDDDFSKIAAIHKACSPCITLVPLSLAANDRFMMIVDPESFQASTAPGTMPSTAIEDDDGDAERSHEKPHSSEPQSNEQPGSDLQTNSNGQPESNEQSRRDGQVNSSEQPPGSELPQGSDQPGTVGTQGTQGTQETAATQESSENVVFLANSEVSLYKATQLVSMISVPGMPPSLTSEDRWAYLHHVFDGCENAIRATGGLIGFLLEHNVLLAQGGGEELVHISSVRYQNILESMEISSTTLQALQIFQVDSHPAGHGAGVAKEGISLFGILRNNLKSSIAGRTLRDWLRCPLVDAEAIVQRQTIVAAFRKNSNHSFVFNIQDSLRGVRNVPGIVNRIQNVAASVADWNGLLSSCKSFVGVIDTFKIAARTDAELLNTDLYRRTSAIDVEDLRTIITWIEAIVDFDESKKTNIMTVVQGFSSDIDELRRCYAGLDDFLTGIGTKEMERIMSNPGGIQLSALLFTYQPQIGYLVLLEHGDVGRLGLARLKDAGFEYMFSSPAEGTFFKNQQCQTLDEDLGDIHGTILDLQAKAIRYLESKVLPLSSTACDASTVVCELDCLQAMAATADEYLWNRPVVDARAEGVKIENGRHALLELNSHSFVSNSTHLRCGDVHMVTGPNFSGKSVYLKQVALMIVMAQIGSCVPAENAEIRPVRVILTRVSAFESISLGHSTFFMDAAQIAGMLASDSKKPSLLLIDEFGKGTSEIDGMALLAATLRSVLDRDVSSTMCLCATHYIEILSGDILPMDNPRLASFSMEMLAVDKVEVAPRIAKAPRTRTGPSTSSDRSNPSNPSTHASSWMDEVAFVRTYRLLRGTICGDSRYLQCAMEQGIDRDVLSRAAEIRGAISMDAPGIINIPLLNTRLRLIAHDAQSFVQMDLSTIAPDGSFKA